MPIKPSHILGMNSRYYYTKLNPASARQYGFSKLKTKELLLAHNIPTAQIYRTLSHLDEVEEIDFSLIPTPFVIKPASGSAGKGILLIKKRLKRGGIFLDHEKNRLTEEQLKLHLTNILSGEYNTWGSNYQAIIEEFVESHPILARLSYGGTADIRVIVFNSVPVMVEVRVPTKESQGKANLELGAIGLGVDMATGTTTHATFGKKKIITHFPQYKNKKVSGIKLPFWKKTLITAVKAANVAGYVFMGADLFIHPTKGPMVVELNGFPGLSIQIVNRAGLKRRLERVEDLYVRDAEHGVKIAQALFAERLPDQFKAEEGLIIIPNNVVIEIKNDQGQKQAVKAIANTGRFRSAISRELAQELGLADYDDLLWQQETLEGKVPVVEVDFYLKNKLIKSAMVLSKKLDRKRHKVEIGRQDLKGFLIGDVEE